MAQTLTYKTSYFSDNYQILKENLQIGKLYKIEWLGTTIDTSINDKKLELLNLAVHDDILEIEIMLKKAINLRINVNKLTIKRKLLPSQTKGAPI